MNNPLAVIRLDLEDKFELINIGLNDNPYSVALKICRQH